MEELHSQMIRLFIVKQHPRLLLGLDHHGEVDCSLGEEGLELDEGLGASQLDRRQILAPGCFFGTQFIVKIDLDRWYCLVLYLLPEYPGWH